MPAPEPRASRELLADEMSVLLHDAVEGVALPEPLRQRLFARVARSAAAALRMHTNRRGDHMPEVLAAGVLARELYRAAHPALRPGEPLRSRLVELAPGATWTPEPGAWQREWLLLDGSAMLGDTALHRHDFLLQPAAAPREAVRSAAGAQLLLREAPALAGADPVLQRGAGAAWGAYGPGIERRVMWQRDGQAAMLYRTEPGAAVPRHGHRHDEECLMLAGDIFLDDVLLRPLDYQLAPAGTHHDSVATDTGLLLYAHGDLDLDLQP